MKERTGERGEGGGVDTHILKKIKSFTKRVGQDSYNGK